MRVALSLAAVLGLLWYVQRRVGKRVQQRRDGSEITVVARRALGSKAQLVVVETDDARYVLGVTEHGVNLIERAAPAHVTRPVVHIGAEERATVDATAGTFDELLAAEREAEQPSLRRHRRPSSPDPLRGSIISPQTWRQTAEFLRRAR
ncbi:flagellar biosynthetic protein FliO [Microbacterium sp. AR7-10]|uniref:flagellar biosynthetic protein FliO n=1 Tax=Microbacterium sp. AR7-10 TaxID=1891970 RepID=UPI00210B1556|nr:flagellar biosynthetic protein FliO [Microbacterium sp. AR7-10]